MEREIKMTNNEAEEVLDTILERTHNVLAIKAKEYVRNGDRMHNFNEGARIKGKLRERVLEDFRLKHEISRNDILNDLDKGILPTEAVITEKYGDIINYYILEEMSLKNRIRNAKTSK